MGRLKLSEPFLLVSDVHGNMPALEKALRLADKKGIKGLVSLGDMVDYNPFGLEVVERILDYDHLLVAIRGNHEDMFEVPTRKGDAHSHFEGTNLPRKRGRQVLKLPKMITIDLGSKKRVLLCHENPDGSAWNYLFPWEENAINQYLSSISEDAFFFGHTHRFTYKQFSGKTAFNPGSLGAPRDNSFNLSFAVVHPSESSIDFYIMKHEEGNRTRIATKPRLMRTYSI